MASKKEPGKFTIKFNLMDPQHRQVSDHLEAMGRSKAQFLTNAVIHYLRCSQMTEASASMSASVPIDHVLIETIVRRILSEESVKNMQHQEKVMQTKPTEKKIRTSEDIGFDDAAELLGADSMAMIANTIAAFRQK